MGTKIIIGGSSGIGLEVARQLHQQGHLVVIAGRDESRAEEAAEEVGCLAWPRQIAGPGWG